MNREVPSRINMLQSYCSLKVTGYWGSMCQLFCIVINVVQRRFVLHFLAKNKFLDNRQAFPSSAN